MLSMKPKMALILSCEDGSRRIVDVPVGSKPEDIAEKNGSRLFDLCDSRDEAIRRLANDPNGRADPM
jgi:hypothetical protein